MILLVCRHALVARVRRKRTLRSSSPPHCAAVNSHPRAQSVRRTMQFMQVSEAGRAIQMEYAEMPALRLTFWQAQRLWNLSEELCERALTTRSASGPSPNARRCICSPRPYRPASRRGPVIGPRRGLPARSGAEDNLGGSRMGVERLALAGLIVFVVVAMHVRPNGWRRSS